MTSCDVVPGNGYLEFDDDYNSQSIPSCAFGRFTHAPDRPSLIQSPRSSGCGWPLPGSQP